MVDDAVLFESAEQTEQQSEEDGDENRSDAEFDRCGEDLTDRGEHGRARLVGDAQISLEQIAQVGEVLDEERLVEAELLPCLRDDLRICCRPVAEDGRDRVGGHEVGEQERHHGHAPDQDDRDPDPDEDESEERVELRRFDPLRRVRLTRGGRGRSIVRRCGGFRHPHSAFAKSNETSALDTNFVMPEPTATVLTGWTSGIHTAVSVVALNSFA